MFTGTITTGLTVGGINKSGMLTKTAAVQDGASPELPAGIAGQLTTRSAVDTGIITVATGHGITVDDTVSVFFPAGVHRLMEVTASDEFTISVDNGDGDNLPNNLTNVVICKDIEVDLAFDGDALEMIGAQSTVRSNISFVTGSEILLSRDLTANQPWYWVAGQGVANPLTGNPVAKIWVANGTILAGTLDIGLLRNKTP